MKKSPVGMIILIACLVLFAVPVIATGVLSLRNAETEALERRSHTRSDLSYLLKGGETTVMDWTAALQDQGLKKADGKRWSHIRRMFVTNYVPRETGPAVAIFTPTSKGNVRAYVCEALGPETFLLHKVIQHGDFQESKSSNLSQKYVDFCKQGFSAAGISQGLS